MNTPLPTHAALRLLEKFEIRTPVLDPRAAAHTIHTGVRLSIEAANDPTLGRSLRVTIDSHVSKRIAPVTGDIASAMVTECIEHRAIPREAQVERTLAHLIVKTSRLYEDQELELLRLSPVYLNEKGYE